MLTKKVIIHASILFLLWFPFYMGDARLLVTKLYGYVCKHKCHWSLLYVGLSLHYSFFSAFLRSLFTQPSHLSCDLPRFLQPFYFFVSELFCNLSYFILTMCPTHFIRLLTNLPTIQALGPTSYVISLIILLYTLFTLAILLIQVVLIIYV